MYARVLVCVRECVSCAACVCVCVLVCVRAACVRVYVRRACVCGVFVRGVYACAGVCLTKN